MVGVGATALAQGLAAGVPDRLNLAVLAGHLEVPVYGGCAP